MEVENTDLLQKIEEQDAKEKEHCAVEIKQLKEAQAALEGEHIVLRKELQKRDPDGQAKDIVSAVICKSLHETFNEDLAENSRRNTSLEVELQNLNIQVLDQKSKIDESFSLVEKLLGKCRQLEETSKEFETHSERMHLKIDSKQANIKLLHEHLTICCESLHSREIIIEEQLMKKPAKQCRLIKLFCC